MSYWSVADGAITAKITKEHPLSVNQYLVWQGGELADFELKITFRMGGSPGINSGFQFRSRLCPTTTSPVIRWTTTATPTGSAGCTRSMAGTRWRCAAARRYRRLTARST